MLISVSALILFLSGYGVYGAPKDIPPIAAPILGGKNADKNEYPWLVMLKYNGGFRCSGSIISEKTILTAAHCVSYDPDQSAGNFSIVAGEYDIITVEGTEQEIQAAEVKVHERFNFAKMQHDIALLILAENLTITPSVQAVAALSNKRFDRLTYTSTNCSVSGWGLFNEDTREIALIMQEMAPTNVIRNPACNQKLLEMGEEKINAKKICTFDENAGLCNGDRGGPLGCYAENGEYTQIGISSFGAGTRCMNNPQIFTRVSKFVNWIEANKA